MCIILHFVFAKWAFENSAPITIKTLKNCQFFDGNDSCRLSNYLQTHIFWYFDHISRTYTQIKYKNVWFEKLIIILIRTIEVLIFHMCYVKSPCLNAIGLLTLFLGFSDGTLNGSADFFCFMKKLWTIFTT